MVFFQNKSVFQTLKGKLGLRELQRQAEKRSNHRRSGTTKRFLAEGGSLFIEECRQLGKGIKGDYLFTTPYSRKDQEERELGVERKWWLSRHDVMEKWHECLMREGRSRTVCASLMWPSLWVGCEVAEVTGDCSPFPCQEVTCASSITVGWVQVSGCG